MKPCKKRCRTKKRQLKGGFFSNNNSAPNSECNINNLSMLSKDTGDGQDPLIKLRNNYTKCCPKNFLGRKNSSPYCKQLNNNFQSLSNYQKDIEGYYGDETNVSNIKQIMNEPDPQYKSPINASTKKAWYKFWGGTKTRKRLHKRKKYLKKY
jgi:hypothetical protein